MERLGHDVRAELGRLAPPDAGLLARLAAVWAEVAGPTAARNSMPERLAADGTLHVAASSSTWAYELGRAAPELLDELRGRLGDLAPAALRFTPGRLPAAPPSDTAHDRAEAPDVTSEDRRDAASLVSAAVDEQLRNLLVRSAAASLARARSDRGF